MVLTRSQTGELLRAHDVAPSRALGQNFVVDPNTVRRIARLAGVGPADHVVEIGAGLGSLTLALADTGASVTALEVDRRLLAILEEVLADAGLAAGDSPVRVVDADATTADWERLLAASDRWVLVANLPYNVATPLVIDLLDHVAAIERMLVMVQAELGERLVAGPGGKDYGIPSLKVAYWATAHLVGHVGPDVFLPRPRVGSALVNIRRRARPASGADPATLFALVRTAFGQRRKILRRSLAGWLTAEAIAAAGVAPDARPEQLDLAAWGRLADQVTRSARS